MADEDTVENSLHKRQSYNPGRYILILIIIMALLWVINGQYSSESSSPPVQQSIANNDEALSTRAEKILEESPNMTKEHATDSALYETAIKEGKKQLCEAINGSYVRSECFRYFEINGL